MDIVLFQHIDELGERRGDPYAVLVFHALIALEQGFLNDHGQVLLLLVVLGLAQIHEHGDEGGLSIGGQQGKHLILNGLDTAADLVPQALLHHFPHLRLRGVRADLFQLLFHQQAELLAADVHEGGQMGQGDALAAILIAGHLGDDLGGDVAGGGKAVGPLDHGACDDGAVLQHVFQVHQVAVVHMLGVIIGIVEVDDALPVGFHNILGQQNALADVPGHLAGHIIPLGGIHHRVFIGVLLLGLLVDALNEAEDLVVRGVAAAHKRAGVPVGDVVFGYLKSAVSHDLVLHQVLDLLHRRRSIHFLAGKLHRLRDAPDLHRRHTGALLHRIVCLRDRGNDFCNVKGHFRPISLNHDHSDFHSPCLSLKRLILYCSDILSHNI